MFTVSFRRTACLLLLTIVLTAPWASAAPQPVRLRLAQAGQPGAELFAEMWRFFQSAWAKVGCSLDPGGQCVAVKEGCGLDPSGQCLAVKEGCGIDPGGHCVLAKEGCTIDPGGLCRP